MSTATSTEVKLSDVIKIILQFLEENNFHEAFSALQKQSRVTLNTVIKEDLARMIMDSDWEGLLRQLNYLMLSQESLFDLYELMVDDLIDRECFMAAEFVIAKCIRVNHSMAVNNRQKLLRLEYICENQSQKALYHKPPTVTRRNNIISRVLKQTHQEVQNGRLLTLITQALRYQAKQGLIVPQLTLSLLEDRQNKLEQQPEQITTQIDKIIKYNEQTRVTAISISNSGDCIAIGGIDGLIEIYEPLDYTLHTGLSFQAEGVMLYHEHSIELMEFSEGDEILATADSKGLIKLWNMQTGRLLRKFQHGSVAGCMAWGLESSHLLVGHQNVRLFGVRSCSILKQYTCSGLGNSQEYLLNVFATNARVYTFGQSGTVRTFNYQTQEQINQISIGGVNAHGRMNAVIPIYERRTFGHQISQFMVCTDKMLIELNLQLEQLSKRSLLEQAADESFINIACVDAYVYECISNDRAIQQTSNKKISLSVRDRKTGKIVQSKSIEGKLSIMKMHRMRNLLLTYDEEDALCFWRP